MYTDINSLSETIINRLEIYQVFVLLLVSVVSIPVSFIVSLFILAYGILTRHIGFTFKTKNGVIFDFYINRK
jgi:hypothetical protein